MDVSMIATIDIFRFDTSNEMPWIEAVADLGIAKARVAELMQAKPCEYLIFSQKTGHKISIKPTRWSIVRGKYAIRQWRNT
jgi:hypothetical protein